MKNQANSSETGWEARAALLPARPGVYLFSDREGKVLYVGKAKSLRARVRAYTRESGDGRAHVQFLQTRIRGLDFIVTDTEKEALILENNLIKKHRPRYNIRLRDDKTYYHVRLTLSERYPRLLLTRRPRKGGGDLLFGPFSSSAAVKETIRMLQEIFPLRRCQERFRSRARPCLNHQIGKCLGPCADKVSEEEYGQAVQEVVMFLKGRRPELVRDLKRKMEEAAESEEFERAAALRDRIEAIEKTLERQKVDSVEPVDRDVLGLHREGDRVAIHRLGFRGGVLLVSESHGFARVNLPDEEVLSSFLGQLYPGRGEPPPEILVPLIPPDREVIEETLSELLGRLCKVRMPERGEAKKLVELAARNARESFRSESARAEDRSRALEELQTRLRLSRAPRWIECVDISVLGGEQAVGSVVKFLEGEPDRSGYRRYRIKGAAENNDYEMMREVLVRRFSRAQREGSSFPDLLLVDGGKGQLNVARRVFSELGIEGVDLAGLAKDREVGLPRSELLVRKGERVFVPGSKDPVSLRSGTAGLFLLERVRDEAHRFAVSYHKSLRGRRLRRSVLEDVAGIGPKKAAALLRRFGGLSRMAEAGAAELASVPGVSAADAERVTAFLAERKAESGDED